MNHWLLPAVARTESGELPGTQPVVKNLHLLQAGVFRQPTQSRFSGDAKRKRIDPLPEGRNQVVHLCACELGAGFVRAGQLGSLSAAHGITLVGEQKHTSVALSCTCPSEPQGGTVFTDVRRHPFRQRIAMTLSLPKQRVLAEVLSFANGEESVARHE